MIDTHAHLDALDEPGAAVARAREAGVTRVITIGTGIDVLPRRARDRRRERRRLRGARDRPAPGGRRGGGPRRRAARAARPSEGGRGRRGGPRLPLRRRDARTSSAGSSRRSSRSRASSGSRSSIHTREANDDTAAILGGHDGTVVMHCFSEPGLLAAGARARLVLLLRRQRHLPEGGGAARGGRARCPPTGSSPRRTARTWRRSRCGAGRTSRPTSSTRVAALAAARGEDADELAARIDANATAAFSLP